MYIHELFDWPNFYWDKKLIDPLVIESHHQQGKIAGQIQALGLSLRSESILRTVTEDIIKTSEIEGEVLNREQVRSSVARRLGLDVQTMIPVDRNVEGIVEMMFDAIEKYANPLSEDRLFGWHSALFPTGRSGMHRIKAGQWRDDSEGPMQVVSGPIGREKVHYEAPHAQRLNKEMKVFLNWFNHEKELDLLLKSGIAHLWFVTLHPFDDGNGRIGRTITDMLLARSENSSERFYSLSSQIQKERKEYYDILENTQKGNLDITSWLEWFFNCLLHAIHNSREILKDILIKARFWEENKGKVFNARQIKIINKLLDGLEGNLTSSKWAKLAKCSQDTAYRDITDLIEKNVLIKAPSGGRSSHYTLVKS